MDLNSHRRKIVVGGAISALAVVVLGTALITLILTGGGKAGGGAPGMFGPKPRTAAEALAACDLAASTPGDPQRRTAPVSDEQFGPAAAIEACAEAVAKNPAEPRAHFQFGRSLWLSRRDAEAYEQFKIALQAKYTAAFKYMGDAYRDGRLPPGESRNLATAVALYDIADKGGFPEAAAAKIDAQRQLDSMTFDKSLFQNGDYMERIYNKKYDDMKFPLAIVYYMQGIAEGFEDNNVVFIDQSCKELSSMAGQQLLQLASPVVALGAILGSTDGQGSWSPEGLIDAVGARIGKDYIIDQGRRDATVLYNDAGRYGCKSEVTQQILSHMMIVVKNTSSPPNAPAQ